MFSCHSGANLYPTCTQLWRFINQLERISPSFLTHFIQKYTQAPLLVVCMLRDITIKTQIFIHLSAISIAPTAATSIASIASTASVAHGLSINLPARWLEFYSLLDPEFAPHFPPGLCRHLAIKACGMTSIFIPSLVKLHAARDERQTQMRHEIIQMKKWSTCNTPVNHQRLQSTKNQCIAQVQQHPQATHPFQRFLYADNSPLPATTSPYRAYIKLNRRTNQDRPRMNTTDQYNTRQHNSNRTHNNTIIQHNPTQYLRK